MFHVNRSKQSARSQAISIFRIANGKIVERWGLNTDLIRQLEKAV